MERVLSIDCGTKNLGWSVWEGCELKRWDRLLLTESKIIVYQIADVTRALRKL
jgi:hypothetical protein